jgi:CYTH domain-containing protein
MGTEIERRFLVKTWPFPKADPDVVRLDEFKLITQAYLSQGPNAIRIRRIVNTKGCADHVLTIKGPGGLTRPEFEYPVPEDDFWELLKLRQGNRISKYREYLAFEGKTWEIDRFSDPLKGLLIAECELDSVDETIMLPPWVGPEVTQDYRLSNASLARLSSEDLEEILQSYQVPFPLVPPS